MIVLFNDIKPRGGGTYIAPDGIKNVVQWYICYTSTLAPVILTRSSQAVRASGRRE